MQTLFEKLYGETLTLAESGSYFPRLSGEN